MKYELLAVASFVSVITGCWWLSPPLALIVGGLSVGSLAAVGYLRSVRHHSDGKPQ